MNKKDEMGKERKIVEGSIWEDLQKEFNKTGMTNELANKMAELAKREARQDPLILSPLLQKALIEGKTDKENMRRIFEEAMKWDRRQNDKK